MTSGITPALLVAAGAALVVQNLVMAKITGAASSVLVALLMNSAVGLMVLSALLLWKGGFGEIAAVFRPWFLIPGLLGTFFVFASITGYKSLGAAPTIAVLVASQLVFGLAWDLFRSESISIQGILTEVLGAGLLICGVVLIVSRQS
ncbi:transporter family-2 protein [Pseudosulfitobacter pseudonitzschiae]|uniref:Membrane protein n=1 Tax=Pseudosulfitobacter pseudonitzschiae TaxID=1402135 RepID=A0A073J846_9RHOB|nr:DMT family transporter [Pseudosulfitobacter pseudonitzschiae]KEJ98094.1 membrane protein [Pseudosulfitobacter pseudonitzschiae]QKS09337.1 DMT family transporter [Pseudosulfitobacter pseudonitzschiae]SHE47391.1 transporter family-2 protein [Pseudosulfitobacter pseudonitzschiae]